MADSSGKSELESPGPIKNPMGRRDHFCQLGILYVNRPLLLNGSAVGGGVMSPIVSFPPCGNVSSWRFEIGCALKSRTGSVHLYTLTPCWWGDGNFPFGIRFFRSERAGKAGIFLSPWLHAVRHATNGRSGGDMAAAPGLFEFTKLNASLYK